ncbi:hypothetical protein F4680DRAFT_426302 [Xylaria scruposa]|nr:hypothetical protein F4680DRAFT_426302 [Xylaria scruposa]
MKVQRVGLPIFLDVIDFPQELAQGATDSTSRIPRVPGRIILQDQASILSEVRTIKLQTPTLLHLRLTSRRAGPSQSYAGL